MRTNGREKMRRPAVEVEVASRSTSPKADRVDFCSMFCVVAAVFRRMSVGHSRKKISRFGLWDEKNILRSLHRRTTKSETSTLSKRSKREVFVAYVGQMNEASTNVAVKRVRTPVVRMYDRVAACAGLCALVADCLMDDELANWLIIVDSTACISLS